VFTGRRLRALDGSDAASHHQLLGSPDSAFGRDLPGGPRVRTDFDASVRGPAMSAAVVVATYNERENLPGLVAAILQHPEYRVIIVDDNSPDGTGQIADGLAADSPGRVLVIHRTGPRGLGRSLIEGLKRALAEGADPIFEM